MVLRRGLYCRLETEAVVAFAPTNPQPLGKLQAGWEQGPHSSSGLHSMTDAGR